MWSQRLRFKPPISANFTLFFIKRDTEKLLKLVLYIVDNENYMF